MSTSDPIPNRARRAPKPGRRASSAKRGPSDPDMEGFLDEAGRELKKRKSKTPPGERARSNTGRKDAAAGATSRAAKPSKRLLRSIKDEVVLALLEAGIVAPGHVTTARERSRKEPGLPLWRHLLTIKGVDRTEILEIAATVTGYPRASVVDEQETLNLFDSLKESHSAYWMNTIATRGALPVSSDLDAASGDLTVSFATADPADPELEAAIRKLGVVPELLYAPATVMDPLVDTLVGGRADAEDGTEMVGDAAEDTDSDVSGDEDEDDTEPAASDAEEMEEDFPVAMDAGIERDRVIVSLIKKGLVTSVQVSRFLAHEEVDGFGNGLWRKLASIEGVDRDAVFAEAAAVNVFRFEDIEDGRPDTDFCRLILETMTPEQRIRMVDLNLLPFDYEINDKTNEPTLIFVSHDPGQAETHHLLGRLNSGRFELRYAPEAGIAAILAELVPRETIPLPTPPRVYDIPPTLTESPAPGPKTPRKAAKRTGAYDALFEKLLGDAVHEGASDIHMYPNAEDQIDIHFRVDGRLRRWKREGKVPADRFMAAVRERVGIRSTADSSGPLEGHIQRRIEDAPVRFRVSVLPMTTENGGQRAESIVIRIQDSRNLPTDIGLLGLGPDTQKKLDKALTKSRGMIVLTGPSGSGRTTTMAAALHSVNHPEISTLSIEDPVDYVRDGVRHVQLDRSLELEAALRAVLRHDPDVVLVGEIRDRESAELAVKLANTGHLVFSLLQTSDTVSAVSLLLRMNVEPFLVAYAVNLIVAQRLVREVCDKCRVPDDRRDPVLMRRLGFTDDEILSESIHRANPGSKCTHCAGRGYRGRRVVTEALYFSTPVRHLISESGRALDENELRSIATDQGMSSLAASSRALVLEGATTVEEVMRILQS